MYGYPGGKEGSINWEIGTDVYALLLLHVLSCFSHVRLFATLWNCSPPGSSVHGILQARLLEWVAFPPPGDLPNPGIKPASLMSPALVGRFFISNTAWEARPILTHFIVQKSTQYSVVT